MEYIYGNGETELTRYSDAARTAEILADRLKEYGIRVQRDVPLSAHTTFRIGGNAAIGVFPTDAEQMIRVERECGALGFPVFFIGNGSDILADDAGYPGCVIFTGGMKKTVFAENGEVTADCGVSLTALALDCCRRGLAGMAFAYGIPGSVGGAAVMNAGAYGGEMAQVVSSVTFFDRAAGKTVTVPAEDCAFGYRQSAFQDGNRIVLSVTFSLALGDADALLAEAEDYMKRRREKQPLEYPSAGSVFKRYPGFYTAQLIDEAGFKGVSVGGAQVSEKHAGFIVNRGGATAEDVRTLVGRIQEKIYELHGISIECEIRELK